MSNSPPKIAYLAHDDSHYCAAERRAHRYHCAIQSFGNMSAPAVTYNRYDNRNVHTLESVYGEGYHSPGGDDEVANIIRGLDLNDRSVLDFGCGLGGAAITLVRDHKARQVVAVDIEPAVLERAHDLVERAQLQNAIEIRLIEPGSLPFSDDTFDFIYMNSVSCHSRDLMAFFAEPFRVLAPGGCLLGSEWFRGPNDKAYKQWDDLLRSRGLNFYFVTQPEFHSTLQHAGYEQIAITDRSAVINETAQGITHNVLGSLRQSLEDSLGAEEYASFVEWTRARAGALQHNGSHHCHFRATKPCVIEGLA